MTLKWLNKNIFLCQLATKGSQERFILRSRVFLLDIINEVVRKTQG